jgi:hypothetical protein
MTKVIPMSERFQHSVEDLQEQAWKQLFELESERMRDRHAGWPQYTRGAQKAGGYRNGYYE